MTIRRVPTDFIVEERPDPAFMAALRPAFSIETPHAVYELTKTSLTTPDAVQRLARAIRANPGKVDYAGLKDKHAQTTQHVSTLIADVAAAGALPANVGEPAWSGRLVGFSSAACTAETILGNRFRIVVRDLAKTASEEMDLRADRLRIGGSGAGGGSQPGEAELLFTNYFGAQRFGSARHNQGFIAKHLCCGEFETALRLAIGTPARKDHGHLRHFTRALAQQWGAWSAVLPGLPRCPERAAIEKLATGGSFRDAFAALPYFSQLMSVEAYQSHLWNEVVRRLIRQLAVERAPAPPHPQTPAGEAGPRPRRGALISSDDQFGVMLFPVAELVTPTWRDLIVPMAAPEAKLAGPVRELTAAVLAEEGLTLEQLAIPGLRRPTFGPAQRPLFARASQFRMSPAGPDQVSGKQRVQRTLEFCLPRGSYATVLLRALGQ